MLQEHYHPNISDVLTKVVQKKIKCFSKPQSNNQYQQ